MSEAPVIHACHSPGLDAWEQVNCYCERAGDPAFWAEPLNAVSNLSFLIAALMAGIRLSRRGPADGRGVVMGLILLVAMIGIGSFLFHTYATLWAAAADVAPICVFVFAYTVFAYRRFVALSVWPALGVGLVVTAATLTMPPYFNGSLMYVPALFILVVTGLLLSVQRHVAARSLLTAAAVFAVSLTFRTIDRVPALCEPHHVGTHWLWHLLNGLMLYLLLRAAIDSPAKAVTRS